FASEGLDRHRPGGAAWAVPTLRPDPIAVDESVLTDLRDRLDRARLPNQVDGIGWDQGTELGWLREVIAYWRDDFDWRAVEAELNGWGPAATEVDGQRIHLLHAASPHPGALPLLLSHGWPGSVVEFLDVLRPLTHPDDPADAFTVVAPSLPGYGFSGPTSTPGWSPRRIAAAFAEVMAGLGYERYGVQGGDWGSIVSQNVADLVPERVAGLHLNFVNVPRPSGERTAELAPDEQASIERMRAWNEHEAGYSAIQRTRPQTVGYGLEDSPVGLAAWMLEKFRAWSDGDGDPRSTFSIDRLLANVTVYWVTATATSSARLYWEMARAGRDAVPRGYVAVPTGVANFPGEITRLPRHWVEHRYNVTHWTEPARGGHFAALQVPDLFVDDVRAFFRTVR
ncbi:MAG: epoxide hydrolase family protein, partial [Acidimicrobiia bacterium]